MTKYNSAKCRVTIFCCNEMTDIHITNFVFNNVLLTRLSTCKCLGHRLSDDLSHDDEMARQYRQGYAQGNALFRKFFIHNVKMTESVEITLFRSFCTTLHTCKQ